jgi:hypothetical protein
VIDGIIINLRQKKADMQRFVTEVFQILPLLNLTAFEFPKAVAEPMTKAAEPSSLQIAPLEIDTIIVPAQKDSFEKAFLATNPWWAVRISGGMLPKIKYTRFDVDPNGRIRRGRDEEDRLRAALAGYLSPTP